MTKKLSLLSLAGLAAMSLTACGGGSSDSGSTDTISGNTADGAFQSGAAVTLYSVDASGTETVVDSNIFVSDSLGTYSESGVSNLVGLHKLRVVGTFLNDAGSGDSDTQSGTIDAYFFAADASTSHTVHTSILTHMVAMLIESDASTTADASTGQYQALLNANSQILSFFGIDSSTDATVSDPSQINVGGLGAGSSSSSTSYKSALTKLMAFTAALNDLYKNQSTYLDKTTYSMGDLLTTLLEDVKSGNSAGSALDASSGTQSALTQFKDRVQYYAANPTAINTPTAADTNKSSFLDTPVDMSNVTQIQGFACGDASTASMRNYLGMTYGTSGGTTLNATYDASGNVGTLSGVTNASADMIQFQCPIRAFTSKDTTTDVGGGATPVGASADSWTGSFSLFVTPTTTSSQSVLATISAVNISIGDATSGTVAMPSTLNVEVPTSADIVVTYIDSSGSEKAESYTNASSEWNFLDATTTGVAPTLNVHVGKFLRTIGTQTGTTLANFGTTGTYDMRLGFGVSIGFEDATTDATGLRSLLPTDATVDNTRSLFFNDLVIGTATN